MEDAEVSTQLPPTVKVPSASSNDGDWTCAECDNVNFARRSSCNRCHKSRGVVASAAAAKKRKLGHEIGKAAAEKSRGLFSADDWQCNKCGNVNWARRQQCNVCNAPKFGDVEERTGFGGGYNDRGVVEYKEHEDSDDEYDEFGRKKKKRNSKRDKDDANEEDDEEDDDEEDLSKYDLSDWGDSSELNSKAYLRSKSRSRSPHEKQKQK